MTLEEEYLTTLDRTFPLWHLLIQHEIRAHLHMLEFLDRPLCQNADTSVPL